MNTHSTTPSKPFATFMMGGPASGKTRARNTYFAGSHILDCDEIKKTLPGYDPKNPGAVHAQSLSILNRQYYAALSKGKPFVYDGTGTNTEKYAKLFSEARSAGYHVEVVYVPCDLAVALVRNAQRERTVPEAVVREKYESIEFAFEILSKRADSVRVINAN
jgi:predicted kinase